MNIPAEVIEVMSELSEKYEAYLVGGCVRDSLLGVVPKDWDITTNATPDEVIEYFKAYKTIKTGYEYGTVTILINEEPIEVTTYRLDSDYSDGRRPDSVRFATAIEDDLSRRDFTINAMAYDPINDKLVDPHGGKSDIVYEILQCVGDPFVRFSEDGLRLMRAVRFAVKYNLDIERKTKDAMCTNHRMLEKVSAERIREELVKILMSNDPARGLHILHDTGMLKVILPEIDYLINVPQNNPNHMYDVFNHTCVALMNCPDDLIVRLVVLFHDSGKALTHSTDGEYIDHFYAHQTESDSIAEKCMTRLKFDNATIDLVSKLVLYHEQMDTVNKRTVKRLLQNIGVENLDRWITIRKADIEGQSYYRREYKLNQMEYVIELATEIKVNNEAVTVKDLKIDGRKVMEVLNILPGKKVGEVLNYLLEKVLETPELNTEETLVKLTKECNL